MKAKTLTEVRLNGKDVAAGKTVDIDEELFKVWSALKLAEEVKPPNKDGEKDGLQNKTDSSTGK